MKPTLSYAACMNRTRSLHKSNSGDKPSPCGINPLTVPRENSHCALISEPKRESGQVSYA